MKEFEVESESKVYFVETCPEKIDVIYVNLKNIGIWDEEENKHIIEQGRRLLSSKLNINENQVIIKWKSEIS